MLQMRPNCECCDKDLPPQNVGARFCSFECTFCEECSTAKLAEICQNRGGDLVARRKRSLAKLVDSSTSTDRVYNPSGCDTVALENSSKHSSVSARDFNATDLPNIYRDSLQQN